MGINNLLEANEELRKTLYKREKRISELENQLVDIYRRQAQDRMLNKGDDTMIIIARGKGEGKSSELIKMATGTQNIIICKDIKSCRALKKQAIEMGCKIKEPIAFDEFVNSIFKFKAFSGELLIDDVDLEGLLKYYFGPYRFNIKAVTLTTGEKE